MTISFCMRFSDSPKLFLTDKHLVEVLLSIFHLDIAGFQFGVTKLSSYLVKLSMWVMSTETWLSWTTPKGTTPTWKFFEDWWTLREKLFQILYVLVLSFQIGIVFWLIFLQGCLFQISYLGLWTSILLSCVMYLYFFLQ